MSVCRALSKNNQKARLNALAVLGLAFLCLLLILPDAKPSRRIARGRCPQGCVRRARSAVGVYNCGRPRVGLAAALQVACTSSRLSSPLVSASPWLRPSRPLATYGLLAITLGCPVALIDPQTCRAKSCSWLLCWPHIVLRHCVNTSSANLTVFRRLLLCLINHHLVG